jgi:hypothetical protein
VLVPFPFLRRADAEDIARGHCADGYRFAKRQGKPNLANLAVAQQNKRFCDLANTPRQIRSDSIHREP